MQDLVLGGRDEAAEESDRFSAVDGGRCRNLIEPQLQNEINILGGKTAFNNHKKNYMQLP